MADPHAPQQDSASPAALLDPTNLPSRFESVDALESFLASPSHALIDDMAQVDGDLMVLGVAGKMGPTLARLAKNAAPTKRVIGVARFSDASTRKKLESWGIECIRCDMLDRDALARLPHPRNIVFAAGHKFGATANQSLTWAMNTHVPALVAEVFKESRIVAFSTGNIYPLTRIGRQGASEITTPAPIGEYAQSCLGRERMFEYFSAKHGTAGRIFRLNYAIDMRYGVLVDIATKVHAGLPVDVTMGYVNVIWQGDANARVLRSLRHCTTPFEPINCTGPETLSVRWLAEQFAERFGVQAKINGQEAESALLSDTTLSDQLFGYPVVPLGHMLDWVADWIAHEQPTHGKPTKFEVRDGRF